MHFHLLGPLLARDEGGEVALGTPQQQLVLAALLLAPGPLTVDQLVHIVWDHEPPKTAVATIRTYLSRLRIALSDDVLISAGSNYHCAGDLDLAAFSDLVARSRAEAPDQARLLLGQALDLWRGEPLAGLPGAWAEAERVRLAELRLAALSARLEADLELGRHQEIVGELTSLCAAHPTREHLRGLLMRALFRAGRQAEALAVYAETSELLSEEFGVDPSRELTRIFDEIVAGTATAAPQPVAVPVPRQLPPDLVDFTGRGREVASLVDRLAEDPAEAVLISAVSGLGGVGKTTLAVHVAHRVASAFPDGQLFLDLRGAGDDPMRPEAALHTFLMALGQRDVPEALEELAASFRTALAGRRVLVVLDNAATADQIRPLLPGTKGCAVLVTSRARIGVLGGAVHLDLDVAEPQDALRLLEAIVGAERISAERAAALDLVSACGFLPLAVRIAGARLAARPGWSVAHLRDRLADEQRRLAELRVGSLAMEACFALGYEQVSPELARAFRLLAVPDAGDLHLAMAARLLGLPEPEAEELCETLVDLSLLESMVPGRYRLHDLLKVFARGREEAQGVRQAAAERLWRFLVASVVNAYRLHNPGDSLPDRMAIAAADGASFADAAEGVAWIDDTVLLTVIQRIRQEDSDLYQVAQLAEMIISMASPSRTIRDGLDLLIEQAQRRDERAAEGLARVLRACRFTTGTETARRDAHRAMELGAASGDRYLEASALAGLAFLVESRDGDNAGALDLYERARVITRELGFQEDEATLLGNLAMVHLRLGDVGAAASAAKAGYAIKAELHGGVPEPRTRYKLGVTLAAAGEYGEALEVLDGAWREFAQMGWLEWAGMALVRIAEAHLRAGAPERALSSAERGLANLVECGDDWGRGMALMTMGQALFALERPERAEHCLSEAVTVFDHLGLAEAETARQLLKTGCGTLA
ncbi:BTAD domain-containing putative transcriptional regulator [Nonomuraea sp. NPDC050556]|uniref:AfsR/SARP family transcriptional regulator n=1 Tax=Nonomuraea sp. NPDC050556 TaxID=3364369 RepID=UPI0037A79D7A